MLCLIERLFVSIVAQNRANNYQFFPNFKFGFIINARFCSELTQTPDLPHQLFLTFPSIFHILIVRQ